MDYEAYCALVDEQGGALYKFCRRLSPRQADDLWQETFTHVLERRERLDAGRNAKSYLFTVCVNVWRSELRRRKPEPLPEDFDAASPDPSPEDEAEQSEEARRVRALVAGLDEKYRTALLLYYTNELPVEEIARVLRIPPGTVKSRLHKARQLIKARLEDSDHA